MTAPASSFMREIASSHEPAHGRHRVVVVGAGFGGLETVQRLAGSGVDITLVDRRNHHLFQPLLYQVAGASLSPSEIAWPIRSLFAKRKDVRTLLAEVEGVDAGSQRVLLEDDSTLAYDTLVIATGARHSYFGHDQWEPFAPGLKSLEDATTIRRRLLVAFEEAERETDSARRAALQTFVIIGGGPTGVELAGTIAELAGLTLVRDFRSIDPRATRVVLIEAGQRLLQAFPEDLSAYARQALEKLGVEIKLGSPVTECSTDGVVVDGKRIPAETILWAAGVLKLKDLLTPVAHGEYGAASAPKGHVLGKAARDAAVEQRVAAGGSAHKIAPDVRRTPNLSDEKRVAAQRLACELLERLEPLIDLGLGYISLDRSTPTLSSGELQRLRLATQLSSQLFGVVYVLDEPSAGLHPADGEALLTILERLKAAGNSLFVVEHDLDVIRH